MRVDAINNSSRIKGILLALTIVAYILNIELIVCLVALYLVVISINGVGHF